MSPKGDNSDSKLSTNPFRAAAAAGDGCGSGCVGGGGIIGVEDVVEGRFRLELRDWERIRTKEEKPGNGGGGGPSPDVNIPKHTSVLVHGQYKTFQYNDHYSCKNHNF
eukprot:TRINITY_DN9759_c0_g2_i2.p2 TRINITY_DN9759_c0_g2~~TRINITY_DN9759_c0_g2_i2.p2  ORF type:complete len:108 (-),score=35.73 TRINITY_DN9759_c0_g2_i2:171-494(-)